MKTEKIKKAVHRNERPCNSLPFSVVPKAGIEPAHLSVHDFEAFTSGSQTSHDFPDKATIICKSLIYRYIICHYVTQCVNIKTYLVHISMKIL